jgi:hypothetical protein
MSLTDIGKQQAKSTDSGGSVDADEYERYDVSGHYYLKPHPTTAVGGTAVALRRFRGDPNDDDDDDWIGLVVEDPFIHTGDDDDLEHTTIFASTAETGDDFKVCNLDDPQTNHMEGTGVDFDKNVFYAEPASSFDEVEWFDTSEDRLIIKLTGNAGRSAARCLDVDGLDNAGVVTDEDGTPELSDNGYPYYNGGLVETHPDNDGDTYTPPRYARDSQLRPDLESEEVAFMLQYTSDVIDDYDGDSYWSTVLRGDADTETGFEPVEPTDEFEADEELVRATRWLDWRYPDTDEINELREANGFDPVDS